MKHRIVTAQGLIAGEFVGSFLVVLIFLAACTAIGLHQTRRSLWALRNRTLAELSELKSELAARHVIVLHLLDSLPKSFDQNFDRDRCNTARLKAESSLASIDVESPAAADIRESIRHEENLHWLMEDLARRIEADGSLCDVQPVAACLLGLGESNRKIKDTLSTYNTSAITYTNYLQRPVTSMVARWMAPAQFELFNINLHNGDSVDGSE